MNDKTAIEKAREALVACAELEKLVIAIEQYEEYTDGQPNYGTCRSLGKIKKASIMAREALAALDAEKPTVDVRDIARRVIGFGLTEASGDVSRKIGIQEAINKTGTLIEAYAAKKCAAERLRTLEEVKEALLLGNLESIAIVIDGLIGDAKKAVES